ncbi:hypothetical protein CerSpe_064870 [Prunus speciosa]
MINAGHEVSWHSAESITRSIQMQIVDALRLGERGKASNLLLNLGRGNDSLRADDFVYILDYCAESPDPLLAVWQQNLPAAHEIWKDYIKHYSLSLIPLRKFIWSFTRLGDLKSAYEKLQYMVALAIRGNTYVNKTSEGKLYSSRLDIPIPSTCELNLKKLDLEENNILFLPYTVRIWMTMLLMQISALLWLGVGGEVENVQMDMLDLHNSQPVMTILRWSFSDVIHACARLRNGGLPEQLIIQLRIMQQRNLKPV